MSKTFHFIACLDSGIPVALCLEHDLVMQAGTMDNIQEQCVAFLRYVIVCNDEEGTDPWSYDPPPPDVVQEFRGSEGSFEFSVVLEDV